MVPVLAFVLAAAMAADPVEIQPGVTYEAGTHLASTPMGVSFTIPTGWKGGAPVGADGVLLASDVHPGVVLVVAETGTDVQKAASVLSQPLPVDAVTVLQPAGAPTIDGSDLRQRYTGSSAGQAVVGVAAGRVTPAGNAIAFVALGPEAELARYEGLVGTLVGSVREVARPSAAAPQPPVGPVADLLRGRQLYYLKVSNGFSSESRVNLCSDGSVIQQGENSGMSTGGVGTLSYASASGDRGAWTVTGSTVLVTWADGSSSTWPVVAQGGQVKILQDNWWVQDQGVCP